MVASMKFFLGKDPEEKDSDDSDSDDEPNVKEVMMANKVNKKTKKREKQLSKVKKLVSKSKKKKSSAPVFNFSAIHLLHDPQGLAEKLFKQLESTNKRFEVKLMTLDVISRLIGLHSLFLLNYYPYIQRFIQPHQREVTRILQFAAQASHDLVPPDAMEPLLKSICNNFITERNSSDVIAIGLNAVREICARCPLAMNEDLLRDLAQYKNYRDRSVMMASRSLIQLFRTCRPELLHKKDRGRPTEASAEMAVKQYAQLDARDYIPGAEVLLEEEHRTEVEIDSGSDSDGDGEEWIDIPHSSDEEAGQDDDDDDDDGNDESAEEGETDDEDMEEEGEEKAEGSAEGGQEKPKRKILKAKRTKSTTSSSSEVQKQTKTELAQKISIDRILTDEDFKRIEAANIRKQMENAKKGAKRKVAEENPRAERSELVKLGDIENIYKKRKHDKQTRIESVRRGQADREKFGYKDGRQNENCSRTNRERKKKKAFQMIKHKLKGKVKRSFKDKQIALRNHLVKQKRMK